MPKQIKTILLFALGLLVLIIIALITVTYLPKNVNNENINVNIKAHLDDADLFYASLSSFGLCSNEKHEQGGCYTEYYLYNSGKFIKITGWQGENGKKSESPSEKTLSKAVVEKIKKQIRDSGIMSKDCPKQLIMDASWDYQVTLDGVKKSFRDPPDECKSVFQSIDDILVPPQE